MIFDGILITGLRNLPQDVDIIYIYTYHICCNIQND